MKAPPRHRPVHYSVAHFILRPAYIFRLKRHPAGPQYEGIFICVGARA